MKEHIVFEKIEHYEKTVKNRPISLLPNLLLLSYMALGKKYDKLATYSEQFLMSNPSINILVEDFVMLSNIANEQESFADISYRNIHSLDPEDPYANLLQVLIEPTEENLCKTKIFLPKEDVKKLGDIMENTDTKDTYNLYRVPDVIGMKDSIINKIKKALDETPADPVLRTSLAEAYLKTNQIEDAKKEINTVISIYPNYTRALYIQAKIEQDYYENEEKGISIYKKIYNLNPVSPYLKGIEIVFLSDEESYMVSELKSIFKYDNPFVLFFKENFKPKKENTDQQEKTALSQEIKEKAKPEGEKAPVREEEPSGKQENLSTLDRAYEYLAKGDHKNAIESFLKSLKEK